MRWSWPIARISGIDLKIHVTFVLIILLGAAHWSGFGIPGMAFGATLMLLLFACVTLHEFGHALVAQRLGIAVREIVLLPIGGVAVLSRNPSRATHELLIAAAGPAVNVAIAIGLVVLMGIKAAAFNVDPLVLFGNPGTPSLATAMIWLLQANVLLVVFNLIPAFPLDGGRILRGTLGLFMDWIRATRIATTLGQIIAVGLGFMAIMSGNLFLGVIAVFIFFGATHTYAAEQAQRLLATLRVGDAYNRHALTLSPRDRLSRVTDHLLKSYQPDFAVVQGRELAGVVSREQVLEALSRGPDDMPVSEVMTSDVLRVSVHNPLSVVQERMQECAGRVAAVYDERGFLGLVGAEDIAEAHVILTFLQRNQAVAAQYAPPAVSDAETYVIADRGRAVGRGY
jgi:Zn-dependent protease/predicted transcriptional regulator